MKILVIITLSVFCATKVSNQVSLSCVWTFFREKKIVNFAVVHSASDGKNEQTIMSFFRSLDTECNCSVTVASNISNTLNASGSEIPKKVILFASSPADIDSAYAMIHLENTRIFIILTNEKPSTSSVESIFQKFCSSMQSQVTIAHQLAAGAWKFYRLDDDRCTTHGSKVLAVVAECSGNGSDTNFQYSTKKFQTKGKSCPLIVAAKRFEPFTYYDNVKGFYNGIDYLIVKTISDRLQLDVKFIRSGHDSLAEPKTIE